MTQNTVRHISQAVIFSLLTLISIQQAFARSDNKNYQALTLYSNQAIVVDQANGRVLYSKNPDIQKPIASITKLMTAIVALDAKLPLDEKIQITTDDIDTLRNSRSRLKVGPLHTRRELLHLALMSSENRAASALARNYPGGKRAFIAAMNKKAKAIGMINTRFKDSTGLDSGNVSTARDLVKLVQASFKYSLIRQLSTSSSYDLKQKTVLKYRNSNPLFRDKNWQIGLSKTGYIKPSGHCLVMQTQVQQKPIIIVLLDAAQRSTVSADSNRIKKWFAKLFGNTKLASADRYDEIGIKSETVDDLGSYTVSDVAVSDSTDPAAVLSLTSGRVGATFESARPLAIGN